MAHYFDLGTKKKVDFVHLAVNEEVEIGLWNVGGPPLRTEVDSPGVAAVLREAETPGGSGLSVVKLKGVGGGNSLVRARNPQRHEWALTQVVVRQPPAAAPITSGGMHSVLDTSRMGPTRNAELTITLRLHLQQNAAGSGVTDPASSTVYTALAWDPAAWAAFTRTVQRDGQKFWDGKYWLVPPPQYFPLVKKGYRHNVHCRLKLELVAAPAAAHRVIQVARLASSVGPYGFTSWAGTTGGQLTQFDLGWVHYLAGGKTYYQRTFLHELVHALGMGHILELKGDPTCAPPNNQSATPCYGVIHADRKDISGYGHALSVHDAFPWKKRIALHTNTNEAEWRVTMTPTPPRRV